MKKKKKPYQPSVTVVVKVESQRPLAASVGAKGWVETGDADVWTSSGSNIISELNQSSLVTADIRQ